MSAVEEGYKSLKAKEDLEKNFPTIDGGTPSYRHQQVMKSGPESIGIARNGYVENIATEKLRSAQRRQTTPWHPPAEQPNPHPIAHNHCPSHTHDLLPAKSHCHKRFEEDIACFWFYFPPHALPLPSHSIILINIIRLCNIIRMYRSKLDFRSNHSLLPYLPH